MKAWYVTNKENEYGNIVFTEKRSHAILSSEVIEFEEYINCRAYRTPLELAGKNDARWRERIGNAVPPAAAQAIAETVLRTLMANAMNEWLMDAADIWVMPIKREDEGQVIVS